MRFVSPADTVAQSETQESPANTGTSHVSRTVRSPLTHGIPRKPPIAGCTHARVPHRSRGRAAVNSVERQPPFILSTPTAS